MVNQYGVFFFNENYVLPKFYNNNFRLYTKLKYILQSLQIIVPV